MPDQKPPPRKPDPGTPVPGTLPTRQRTGDPAALPAEFRPLTRLEPTPKPEPKPEPKPAAVRPEPTERPAERAAERPPSPRPATHLPGPVRPPNPRPKPAAQRPSPRTTRAASAGSAKPAPVPPPVIDEPDPSRGRSTRKIALLAALALIVVAGAASAVLLRDKGSDPGQDLTSATPSGAPDPATVVPTPPVALVADTEYIDTEVLPDGDLQVTHWLRTAEPVQQLALTPAGDGYTGADITDLVVAADGVPAASADLVAASGWTSPVPETDDLYVTYRLSGVLQASDSAQGRGLVTTTALGVEVGRELLTRTQTFRGAAVLTLACLPPGQQAMPRPCGSQDGDTWSVVNQGADLLDSVIAQVDLGTRP